MSLVVCYVLESFLTPGNEVILAKKGLYLYGCPVVVLCPEAITSIASLCFAFTSLRTRLEAVSSMAESIVCGHVLHTVATVTHKTLINTRRNVRRNSGVLVQLM